MSHAPVVRTENLAAAHAATAPATALAEEIGKADARSPAMAYSLRAALRTYFDAHPDAELSRNQIAEKFFRSVKTVDIALSLMRKAGEMESVKAWRRPRSSNTGGNQ